MGDEASGRAPIGASRPATLPRTLRDQNPTPPPNATASRHVTAISARFVRCSEVRCGATPDASTLDV